MRVMRGADFFPSSISLISFFISPPTVHSRDRISRLLAHIAEGSRNHNSGVSRSDDIPARWSRSNVREHEAALWLHRLKGTGSLLARIATLILALAILRDLLSSPNLIATTFD
jgi:hypothetical protein